MTLATSLARIEEHAARFDYEALEEAVRDARSAIHYLDELSEAVLVYHREHHTGGPAWLCEFELCRMVTDRA